MKNKKSQGLSINVLIITAIALIVLVVLIAIFTGRLGGFDSDEFFCQQNLDECVCEEWEEIGFCGESIKQCFGIELDTEEKWQNCLRDVGCQKCFSYRKLTTTELQEKDCNDNPREDKECKCVKEQLIEYCEYLEDKKYKGEWERGYKYGVQHIRQQLEKSIFRWS